MQRRKSQNPLTYYAVGICIVEGPDQNGLNFSQEQIINTFSHVFQALTMLAAQQPNVTITFNVLSFSVKLDVPPPSTCPTNNYNVCESVWRDPAQNYFGYASGAGGVTAWIQDLIANGGSQWGYMAFFTKYPLSHFAYAYPWYGYLVMDYNNDGWGLGMICTSTPLPP